MNSKLLRFSLFGLLLLLAVWSLIAEQYDWTHTREVTGQMLVQPFQPNAVDRIVFTDVLGPIELKRNLLGTWETPSRQNFPVSTEKVVNFLYRLEHLRAAQSIPGFSESKAAMYALHPPENKNGGNGLRVQIFKQEMPLGDILCGAPIIKYQTIGDKVMPSQPSGRYYRTDTLGPVACAEAFGALDAGASYWLRRTFFSVEFARAMSMTDLRIQPSKIIWSAARANLNAPFFFNDGLPGEADHLRVLEHSLLWRAPNFLDVIPRTEAPKADYCMKFTTADGFMYSLYFGEKIMADGHKAAFFWYNLRRTPRENCIEDRSFDRQGRNVNFPRPEIELGSKFNTEKQFEQWAYLIPAETYAIMTSSRAYLQKKERALPADSGSEWIRPNDSSRINLKNKPVR